MVPATLPRKEPMLVSVHIPKTGGVTMRELLRRALGAWLLFDYGDKLLTRTAADRNGYATNFEPDPSLPERYDCVHGHFLPIKYASVPGCKFAVWLRDPVQWAMSRLEYGKRRNVKVVTPEMTLAEFAELEKFHNVFAKYLWDFDLSRFDFVGITDDYANSLAVFRRQFDLPEAGGGCVRRMSTRASSLTSGTRWTQACKTWFGLRIAKTSIPTNER